MQLNFD